MTRPGTKLQRTSLVDQAVDRIRSEIIDGSLAPGTPLPEGQISESLGLARPTVREVLLRLRSEGLVQGKGRGSALTVTRIDRDQLDDIYTARLHLEMAGARSFDTAGQDDRDALDRSLEALESTVFPTDRMTQLRLDHECHTAVVGLTGSRRLVAVHTQLLAEYRIASITAGLSDDAVVVASHREFVNLLRDGHTEAACDQLERRLTRARERIAQNLPG